MKSQITILAGVCGFRTSVDAVSDDAQTVSLTIHSDCEKIKTFAVALTEKGAIDAYQEISARKESVILSTSRTVLKGCCAACVVPNSVYKAMQIAAGLALPKDIHIQMTKEPE